MIRCSVLSRLLVIGLLATASGLVAGSSAGASSTVSKLTVQQSWSVNGRVLATAIVGNTVIVGGKFTAAAGPAGESVPRQNLAAFDMTTGALLVDWQADAGAPVRAIERDGKYVIVGGSFGRVAGLSRQRLAKIDVATGGVDPIFQPSFNGSIRAIDVDASSIYVGGAFTKVVGDAGVTVAKQAPLPITTGNSYSASGALWAAHEAMQQLGMTEVDARGRIRGKAMVVGATGAIGSVCARLLALSCDELWLVSPESAKLLALKHEIERDNPRAEIHAAATPAHHLKDMDLIVTATSGAGKRVLDIMDVKPGCVITDVARPLDLSPEDVAKRPDVLVIESGEIELPGEVTMKDIGLPPGVVYACMAETVVLALEGRYETYTVGRNIEWEKVKEIYQLGLKHGMKLAAISGVNGVFSTEDLARIRELALERRG